jgi:hypothetical protein
MDRAFWFDTTFLVEGQLFAKKEIFCCEGRTWAQTEANQVRDINEECQQRAGELPEGAEPARESCYRQGGIPLRHGSSF